ncbi:MAG: hypothetical protein V4710_09325, partial [Verrucomicrobiota bacterium]
PLKDDKGAAVLEDATARTQALKERIAVLRDARIFRGTGCKTCRMTGYTGRRAIFELMTMSTPIRQVLLRGGSSIEIKEQAKREGMRPLIEDGWRLVCDGITTPAEVYRVPKDESEEGLVAAV